MTGRKQEKILSGTVEVIETRETNTPIKLMKVQRSNCTGVSRNQVRGGGSITHY